MDAKRIKFERTGGFAGIHITTDFELEDLPEEQARQLRELLDEVDFDELPEQLIEADQMTDGFSYSITVETERHQHTVLTDNTSAPDQMQPLLELLYQIARQQARKK